MSTASSFGKPPSISSIDAERRRQFPLTETEFLRNVLAAHAEIVGAGLDPQKVVDVVARRAQELTHSEGAVVEIVDGDDLVYWSASGSVEPFQGMRVAAARSLSGMCVQSGQVLRCDDSETDERVDRDACRRVGLRSMLVAPLPYGNVIVGVLKVVSPWINAYSATDVRTLELLNTLIGAAIAHAAQHAKAEAESNATATSNAFAFDAQRDHIARIIAANDFRVAFQPIVALRSSRVVGYEALARFPGGRAPNEWFDDAAHVGLGPELELTVARKCLASLDAIPADAYMAVNVSPEALVRGELEALCLRHDPHRIILEITEHTYIDDYDGLMESTARLKSLGVRFAIDDAGAGFASLRHVLRIRPDLIKLDGSITRRIDAEPAHRSLASALLIFAEGTSSAIVAEGIETEAEAKTLRELGVAFGQGYFLGVPAPLPGTIG